MPDSGHFESATLTCRTVAINAAGSGDNTIHTTPAGKAFVVFEIHVEAASAVDLLIKSGSTSISGAMAVSDTVYFNKQSSGFPIFKGRATGDNFVINLSGAVQIDGYAVLAEVDIPS